MLQVYLLPEALSHVSLKPQAPEDPKDLIPAPCRTPVDPFSQRNPDNLKGSRKSNP